MRAAAAASTISGLETANSRAVVLPHAEERQPDLVGEHRLVDDVPDGLRVAHELAGVVAGDVSEGVETELEAERDR